MAMAVNHYEVLGTSPGASLCELKAAFKRKALALHPDKGGSKEGFQRALQAFEVLSDDVSRAHYDSDLRNAKRPQPVKKSARKVPSKKSCFGAARAGRSAGKKGGPTNSGTRGPAGWEPGPTRPPSNPSRAAKKARVRQSEDRLLNEVFTLLQKLSNSKRLQLLQHGFTQAQRLALEAWVLARAPGPPARDSAAPGDLPPPELLAKLPLPILDARPMLLPAPTNLDAAGLVAQVEAEEAAPRHASVRGIAAFFRRGRVFYQASVCIQTFHMTARKVPELDRALDVLLLLLAVRQRAGSVEDTETFAQRIQAAVPAVLHEHGVTAEDIGLRFNVMICMRFWVSPTLHTPQQKRVEEALRAWRRLTGFRAAKGQGARGIARMDLSQLEDRWLAFREVYLDILEEGGHARESSVKRLDAMDEAARPFRERRLERWNRLAMSREDRPRHRGKKAAVAFERSLRPKLALRNLRGGGGGRKRASGSQPTENDCQDRVAQRLARLLLRWERAHRKILHFQSMERKAAAKLAARRRQKQAAAARQEARRRRAEAAAARSAERIEAKRRREELNSRWKWLNRKDITMEELLHFRNAGCHTEAEENFPERTTPVRLARNPLTSAWLKA